MNPSCLLHFFLIIKSLSPKKNSSPILSLRRTSIYKTSYAVQSALFTCLPFTFPNLEVSLFCLFLLRIAQWRTVQSWTTFYTNPLICAPYPGIFTGLRSSRMTLCVGIFLHVELFFKYCSLLLIYFIQLCCYGRAVKYDLEGLDFFFFKKA